MSNKGQRVTIFPRKPDVDNPVRLTAHLKLRLNTHILKWTNKKQKVDRFMLAVVHWQAQEKDGMESLRDLSENVL